MKDLKILQNKDGKVIVEVKIKKRRLISDPYIQVGYGEVMDFLKSKGINKQLKLVKGSLLGNHADNIPRVGEFVFIDTNFEEKPTLNKQDKKEALKETGQKNNLTSEVESDTITVTDEEIKPVTKRRRRRPRAAAKKENKLLGTETVE